MGRYLQVINLASRILSFASLVISVIVFLSASASSDCNSCVDGSLFNVELEFTFKSFYAYRYTIAANGAGIFYSFVQIVLSIILVQAEDQGSDGLIKFNIYSDMIMTIVLGTGVAAGFGLTVDLNRLPCASIIAKSFSDKMLVACGFSLGGFVTITASSLISLKIFEQQLDVCC